MTGVLVVGYGNPLRGDDGAGFNAAWLLSLDPRLQGADVLIRQQLTPELAEDVARADLVVLIDAAVGGGRPDARRPVRARRPRAPRPARWRAG